MLYDITEFDVTDMEDPTAERLEEARKATFAIGWPHESKRGWTCKTEKMVMAGEWKVRTDHRGR